MTCEISGRQVIAYLRAVDKRRLSMWRRIRCWLVAKMTT